MNAEPVTTDYTAMPASKMVEACGDNAMSWAVAFCQTAKIIGIDLGEDPEGWIVGWFANAIEHSSDVRHWRGQPQTQPSVSRFPS